MSEDTYPLVELVWIDPLAPFEAWTQREDALRMLEEQITVCRTVGYLIVNEPDRVALVSSINKEEMGSGLIVPRVNVRELRPLAPL